MGHNNFNFQMKVARRERKEAAGLIASHFGTQAVYQGAPRFEYLITEAAGRKWRIDRNGAVITHGTMEDDLTAVFAALKALEGNGITAQGQAAVSIATAGT